MFTESFFAHIEQQKWKGHENGEKKMARNIFRLPAKPWPSFVAKIFLTNKILLHILLP